MQSPPRTQQTARSDSDLLRRFREFRDESAATELIGRHAALVRGVCLRLLGNSPDADDAFQATFIVLIRKGERLHGGSLAGWLHGVAHRIARRLRRERSRAIAALQETDAMTQSDPLGELALRHDVALFEAELTQLPEKYRAPIVLHHLEGKSRSEVAVELKVTEGSVEGLLKRGRNELRRRLARRGVVFGITMIVLEHAQRAVASTSLQPLIDAGRESVLSVDSTHHPGLPPSAPARLARQEINSMALYQTTKIVAWTAVVALLAGAAGLGLSPMWRDSPLGEVRLVAAEPERLEPAVEAIVVADGKPDRPARKQAPENPPSSPEEQDRIRAQKARLHVLREEKLKALREGAAQTMVLYKGGQLTVNEVLDWQLQVNRAELDVCANDRERTAALTKALAAAKDIEQLAKRQSEVGAGRSSDALRAKAHRLDIEIALEELEPPPE